MLSLLEVIFSISFSIDLPPAKTQSFRAGKLSITCQANGMTRQLSLELCELCASNPRGNRDTVNASLSNRKLDTVDCGMYKSIGN